MFAQRPTEIEREASKLRAQRKKPIDTTPAVTQNQAPASPFFRLPSEIRKKILTLVLCKKDGKPVYIEIARRTRGGKYNRSWGMLYAVIGKQCNHSMDYNQRSSGNLCCPGAGRRVALDGPKMGWLSSCRQAYAEGIEILYSQNSFSLADDRALLWGAYVRDRRSMGCIKSLEMPWPGGDQPIYDRPPWTSKNELKELALGPLGEYSGLRRLVVTMGERLFSVQIQHAQIIPEDLWRRDTDALVAKSLPQLDTLVLPKTTGFVSSNNQNKTRKRKRKMEDHDANHDVKSNMNNALLPLDCILTLRIPFRSFRKLAYVTLSDDENAIQYGKPPKNRNDPEWEPPAKMWRNSAKGICVHVVPEKEKKETEATFESGSERSNSINGRGGTAQGRGSGGFVGLGRSTGSRHVNKKPRVSGDAKSMALALEDLLKGPGYWIVPDEPGF